MFSKTYSFVNEQFAAETITQFFAFRFNYQALLCQARKIQKLKTNSVSVGRVNTLKKSKHNFLFATMKSNCTGI